MVPNGTRGGNSPDPLTVARHGVPDAVAESRKNQYATNDPVLMGKVNLIQKTVRVMADRNQIASEVRNDNRASPSLSPRQTDTLKARGISFEPVRTSLQDGFERERRSPEYAQGVRDLDRAIDTRRAVDSCAAANRPDPSKGSGGGRKYIPWCSKGGK